MLLGFSQFSSISNINAYFHILSSSSFRSSACSPIHCYITFVTNTILLNEQRNITLMEFYLLMFKLRC
jgi:hypothetical protein